MRIFLIVFMTGFITTANAEEAKFDFNSKKAKASVQKFKDASRKSQKRNLNDLIRGLEAAFKHERTDGDFEEAIKIQKTLKSLKSGRGHPPKIGMASKSGSHKPRIPRNAVAFNGHRYLIVAEPLPVAGAMTWCTLAGGHLMRIESKAEHDFARRLLSNRAGISHVWVDGSDAYREGEWRFSDGQPINYNGWGAGEGRAGNKINQMALWAPIGWSFADDDATARFSFICEWDQ